MITRIYVRASTKDQDAERALDDLREFTKSMHNNVSEYIENESGTKLDRPVLNQLLDESNNGDILLVESVDRLSRLTQSDFDVLKGRIKEKGLRLVVADLPTTHMLINSNDNITSSILNLINNMLIDLLATMARLDNDKRRERIKQGLEKSGYKPTGKKQIQENTIE
jgi:DNA invertase Pin-like site-specific DNA recombinase